MMKGWSREELSRAIRIMERAQDSDVAHSHVVYWSVILCVLFGSMLIMSILIPVMLFLEGWFVYFISVLLALIVGAVYVHLIDQIHHITQGHHLFGMTIIPLSSIVILITLVQLTNRISILHGLSVLTNPVYVAMTFGMCMFIPIVGHRLWVSRK